MARHDLLHFLHALPALEVVGGDGGDGEHLHGAEQQHVGDARGHPGGGAAWPPSDRERVHGRHRGAERARGDHVHHGLRAAASHQAPRARHRAGAPPPGLRRGHGHGHVADDGEVDEEERGQERQQRVEEEEQEGVVEEDDREHGQGEDGGGARQLQDVPERDGQYGSPDVAPRRAERGPHGGAPVGGGVGGDCGEDGGDLDGGPGHHGAEEAGSDGEQEALEVGLEGPDEVPVRGGGRVHAADGVRVEKHRGGQRLHGEGVAEEQRRGERGREDQQREEERGVPDREDGAVLQERQEARRRGRLLARGGGGGGGWGIHGHGWSWSVGRSEEKGDRSEEKGGQRPAGWRLVVSAWWKGAGQWMDW